MRMDSLAALPQPVIDALARGWTVLTGNQRAARTMRQAFNARQHALGLTHWQPPSILAWDSWLALQWRCLLLEGRASQLLLNPAQEHVLWRSIITADSGTASLRPVDSLAELATDAWLRLHTYQAQHRLHATAATTDTRTFARWAREFERRCLRAEYITAAQLPEALATATKYPIALPHGLLFAGFDTTSPAQTAMLQAIRSQNIPVEEFNLTAEAEHNAPRSRVSIEAPDPHSELLACAQWLRIQLEKNPTASIAVIVSDLDSERAAIDRALRGILAPEMEPITASSDVPFEFSMGRPLDRTALGAAALDVLRWCAAPLPLDRISALLLSPHFAAGRGAEGELIARAEFDAFVLRDHPLLEPQIALDHLAILAAYPKTATQLSALRVHLGALGAAIRRAVLTRERTHAEWVNVFQELLDAAGWAPSAGLDSAEFQEREKWESVLDEFATLDFDPQGSRVPFRAALDGLARIVAQTLFAPESRQAPVQIMGPLESAGSSFDALWFLGAGDLEWPPAPSLNPLLPYSLQRDFSMPGSSATEDTARALRSIRRIAASAPTVVFSYARHTPAGQQRPSPLLSSLQLEAADVPPGDPSPVPTALERLLDTVPIPAPPTAALRGGAAILEAQAACPFRAFAERRLFSTALERASLGLDARERGSIVHNVLHAFWVEVGSQAALRRMAVADRDMLLAKCIDSALARNQFNPRTGWPIAYIEAERERLLRQLSPWLDYEAGKRSPFVVKSCEKLLKGVAIGPLHLDIRVDRLDETVPPAGSSETPAEIILDYKTGVADPAKWEGDRPDSPQLPLYAVASDAPQLAAIAFANIRPGKLMGLFGYQSQNGILPNPKRGQTQDLEAKRGQWRNVLTSLAEEFHAGRAIATPKDYPNTCRYCRQRLVCRLDPATLAQGDDVDTDEADAAASPIARGPEPLA